MSYRPRMGDIVLLDFAPSQGHEQVGKRPALVVSNDLLAETSPFAWVVPITHGQWAYPTHISLDGRTKTDGTIYVEQLLTIDYRIRQPRFLEKLPADKLADVLHLVHELTRP